MNFDLQRLFKYNVHNGQEKNYRKDAAGKYFPLIYVKHKLLGIKKDSKHVKKQ